MIDLENIKSTIFSWLDGAVNLESNKIIFSDQDAPRPEKPYMTVKLQNFVALGHAQLSDVDGNGLGTFIGDREFTVSLQTFGENAFQYLDTALSSLARPNAQTALDAGFLAFVDHLTTNDITDALESGHEERAQMDLLFRIASVSTEDVGLIEKVEAASEMKDETGTVRVSTNLTIS